MHPAKVVPGRDPSHPVWDVYDLYRRARLNVKYYCGRLEAVKRWNFAIEFVIALTATGSAVASLTIWQTEQGKLVWQVLGGAAAVLAIAKPLLNLPDRISGIEELIAGYRTLEHDLKRLEVEIRARKAYDKSLMERFSMALERMTPLESRTVEGKVYGKLRRQCETEVNKELPASHFYLPEA